MYFVPLFCLVGLVQSVDFPCLIGTIGAWTYKSSRGIVTGFWATCSPIGNIIGLQLSVIILNLQNNHWEFQMYYITVCYFILAGCIWFYFIGNPKDVGLVVESEVIDDDF